MSRPSKWYYTGLDLGVKLAVEEKTLYLIEEGERDGWSQEFNRGLTDGYFEQVVEQLEEAGKEIEPICTQCDKVFDSEANSLHHLWVQHSEKATALFVVNRQETSSSSGNIVEFKAGRSRLEAGNGEGIRNVVAEQTKGLVFIKQIDDMVVHFYWKNRETGSVVMDLIVFPDDAEFKPVHGCPDGKVFMLKFKSSGEMKVFWLQDTSPDADKDLVKKVNDALNKPSTSRPSAFRSSGSNAKADRSAAGGSLISGQDFNAMGGLDQGQLISLIQSLQGKNSDSLPLPSSGSGGPHTAGSTEASSEADCEPPASSGASSSSSNAPLSFENPAIAKIFSNLQRKDAACLRKFSDLCFNELSLFYSRIIQCHETLAMVFFGPCTFVSTSFCHFLDAVHLHALQNWILSQILLIGFRTAMLSSAQSFLSVKRTVSFCILAWLPGLVSLVCLLIER
uniref:Proteasomal ubiquitin receptor ADRM1 homolog n=1 Tax=Caenorhabditis tropicalis TaxID=1561998 RepID=A0A1I7TMN1_9PELO